MTQQRRDRLAALLAARAAGWRLRRTNNWNYCFERPDEGRKAEVLNFYWNRKNPTYTIQTTINHPTKGRTQLNRKYITIDEAIQLFTNPRQHTGKGYRTGKR